MTDPRDETTSLLLVLAVTGLLAWGVTSWWLHGPRLLRPDPEPSVEAPRVPETGAESRGESGGAAAGEPGDRVPGREVFVHSFEGDRALLENKAGQQKTVQVGNVLDTNLEILSEDALETIPGAFRIQQIDSASRTVEVINATGETRALPHISERRIHGEKS